MLPIHGGVGILPDFGARGLVACRFELGQPARAGLFRDVQFGKKRFRLCCGRFTRLSGDICCGRFTGLSSDGFVHKPVLNRLQAIRKHVVVARLVQPPKVFPHQTEDHSEDTTNEDHSRLHSDAGCSRAGMPQELNPQSTQSIRFFWKLLLEPGRSLVECD